MVKANNKGMALITVLLVVAIATIIATDMTMRIQMQIQRSQNLQSNEQAYWYAIGAEEFVRLLLKEAFDSDKGVFHLEQSWAMQDMVFPLDDGEIAGSIQDLHACFNLNAIYVNPKKSTGQNQGSTNTRNRNANQNNSDQPQNANQFKTTGKKQFMALLESVEIDNYLAEKISDSMYDWLDPDSNTSAFGAEDYIYEARIQPHLAANSPMVDMSEFRVVEGVNKSVMDKLNDLICVIPDEVTQAINVNTLTEEKANVLHAMFAPKLTLAQAKTVIGNRPGNGYKNINDFWQESEIAAMGAISAELKAQFTIKSTYFKMKAKTEYNRSWIGLESTIKLDQKGVSKIIARKIGV